MKKIFIMVLIFSFNGVVFSSDNNPSGFRNVKWKAPFSMYKDVMHLTSEQGDAKKFYTIENDDMLFGKVNLTSIVYIFINDKFASVALQTDRSAKNLTQVLVELKNEFGEPSYSNKYINKYRWDNKKTKVSLKCYSSSHKCSIKYNSTEMSKKL